MLRKRMLITVAAMVISWGVFAQGTGEELGFSESSQVWTGPDVEFTKADGADPDLAENQDRITENLWITRGNSGGQIYNAVSENIYNKFNSPVNILWALGSTEDDISQLEFTSFRNIPGGPKNIEGKDLVLYIESDDIYLDVQFTSWSQGKLGGFSYIRSSSGE